MTKRSTRTQRINDLIQTEIAAILQREATDLNIGMVTVTGVEVAPDLSFARVFVSVLEDHRAKETISSLNTATKFIRYSLAQVVKLRITPDLRFVYDDSSLRGTRISSLIHNVLKDTPSDDSKK